VSSTIQQLHHDDQPATSKVKQTEKLDQAKEKRK
jgi:hypothetical protein